MKSKKRNKKILSALAAVMAAAMLLTGCGGGDGENGETTASVNVIGGSGSADDGEGGTTTAVTAEPGVVITDENGETVTGLGGNVLTEPTGTVSTFDPAQTLSDEDVLAAMTGTTTRAQLNLSQGVDGRYGYSTLNDEEKKLYDAIKSGIENLQYKICSEDAYSLEEWAKIYGMVYTQEPQLFYMNAKIKVGKLFYLTKDADAINQMQKAIDAVADKLVAEAAGKSSTFEKLEVFHDYLVLNSNFEKLEDLNNYNSTIYNAFASSETQGDIQCGGYAKAMLYLCDKAGIPCMVVTGENESGSSHAWNVVNVDGQWYNIDSTWDDPILQTPNYKNLRHKFFLVPDSAIHNITHFHVSQKKLSSGSYITYFTPPACTDNAQNYFTKKGTRYSDFDSADAAIRAAIKKACEDGSRTAEIGVATKELYDKVYAARMDYNNYAKEFSGVKGVSDECSKDLLVIEFDVIYN